MTKSDWEQWKDEHNGNYGDLIDFANDNGVYEAVEELISSDDLDERVKEEAESGGWQRVACFLETAVQHMNEDYYSISAYGNVELAESWDYYADEVENLLEFDEYVCDVCGEDTDTLYSIEEWIDEEEENLSDEVLELVRKADDNYDRCPKCWEELKEKAQDFINRKDEIDMDWLDFLEGSE